jgi:hypothetical protein
VAHLTAFQRQANYSHLCVQHADGGRIREQHVDMPPSQP